MEKLIFNDDGTVSCFGEVHHLWTGNVPKSWQFGGGFATDWFNVKCYLRPNGQAMAVVTTRATGEPVRFLIAEELEPQPDKSPE